MGLMLDTVGKLIAKYLQKELPGYEPFTPSDPERLRGIIEEGDVLLVEGNNRVSGIIKYLTQSTWSHAALYVGPIDGAAEPNGEPHVLIEANIGEGVTSAPLSKYYPFHTRLCRPVGLSYEDRTTVCRYAINRIGFGYDTKNILDLMRFLIPLPIPQRWRRRMIAFGSGDPTKIICSALIAQAFDAVRYPILPKITRAGSRQARREILHIRDLSLYMPRDFDISPYFEVVKPTIVEGFDLGVEPRVEAERFEHPADDLGQIAPQHRVGDVDGFDVLLGEPGAPALFLGVQHGDHVGDGAGVVLGAGVADRVGPAAPHPGLHGPPERHRLRDHVGPVDMDQDGVASDHIPDRRQQAVAGALRQILRAVEQQRRLIPHQLAAPHPVGCPPHGADVVPPDGGGSEVGLARVERVEQPQDRFVGDSVEPLPGLRRLAGGGQVLEELLRFPCDTRGPERLDQQGAAAALRREHQICRRMV